VGTTVAPVHTFLAFFAWPDGTAWSNVAAMPLCGILAGVAAFIFRDHIGRALSGFWHRHFGHRDELDAIRARLDAHADLLDLSTPGGLAAVMSAVQDAKTAAESAHGAVQGLALVAGAGKPAAAGKTRLEKTAPKRTPGGGT
jgi:hypothetical protein